MIGSARVLPRAAGLLVGLLCCLTGKATIAGPNTCLEARGSDIIVRVQSGANESAMIGSYALRIYQDEIENFVTGVVAEREGGIAGLWLVDLDRDGGWEILVWTSSGGSGAYGRLDRYRVEGDCLVRDDLPPASAQATKQYMGHDDYVVKDGDLWRSFPLYNEGDPNAEPSGGKRTLIYRADERRWVVLP